MFEFEKPVPDKKEPDQVNTNCDSCSSIPTPDLSPSLSNQTMNISDINKAFEKPDESEYLDPSEPFVIDPDELETPTIADSTNEQTIEGIDSEEEEIRPLLCPYCHNELIHLFFDDESSAYVHKIPNDKCNRVYKDFEEITEAERTLKNQKAWAEERASFHEELYCPICNHLLSPKFNQDGTVCYYHHPYEQQQAEQFDCQAMFWDMKELIETRKQINRQIREKIEEYLHWSNYYRSSPKNDHELVCPYCKRPMFIARDGNNQCFIVHDIRQLQSDDVWKDMNSIMAASPCQAIFSDITDLVQVERIRRKLSDVSLIPLCPLCGDPLEAFVVNGHLEFRHDSANCKCSAVYKDNMTAVEQARLALVTMDMMVDPKPDKPLDNIPDFPDELVAWYKETTEKMMQEAEKNKDESQNEKPSESNEIDDDLGCSNDSLKQKPAGNWFTKLFSFHSKK